MMQQQPRGQTSCWAVKLGLSLCLGLLVLGSRVQGQGAEHQLKLDLSPLLDSAQAWAFTQDTLSAKFQASGFKENPFIRWNKDRSEATFSKQPFTNVSVDLTAQDGKLKLEEAIVFFGGDGKACRVELKGGSADLETHLRERFGADPKPGSPRALGWKRDAGSKTLVWSDASHGRAILQGPWVALEPAGSDPIRSPDGGAGEGASPGNAEEMTFFVRLDDLFSVPKLWNVTQDSFEKAFAVAGVNVTKSPFYQWNTNARDGARMARKMYSNTNTDLLMFDDTVNAEEANLDFKNGRASKLTITLLTRGNSGEISASKFDAVFKAAGRALGASLGVRPQRSTPAGVAVIKTDGWLWTTPHTLALLEFNTDAPKGKVEFLRLTFVPASARAELLNLAGIGGNVTTRRRDALIASVSKNAATGDVEITGIPMRDQGQKGYCVAASCERLMRYLGVPCDMDELARLVSADAERGASPAIMYGSLTKIDQRYNMRAKLLKIPSGYGLGDATSRNELERAWKAELRKLIQDNVNQGLPLLWCVLLPLGQSGISPSNDNEGGTVQSGERAGHMRLIIGYNTKSGDVIYTDSWGAGHERKVMSLAEADEMTTAVFSMTPSR